jgi:hypothetical protein
MGYGGGQRYNTTDILLSLSSWPTTVLVVERYDHLIQYKLTVPLFLFLLQQLWKIFVNVAHDAPLLLWNEQMNLRTYALILLYLTRQSTLLAKRKNNYRRLTYMESMVAIQPYKFLLHFNSSTTFSDEIHSEDCLTVVDI